MTSNDDFMSVKITKGKIMAGPDQLQDFGDEYLRQFISLREINQLAELSMAGTDKAATIAEDMAILDEKDREELREFGNYFARAIGSPMGHEVDDAKVISPPSKGDENGLAFTINSPEVSALISALVQRKLHHTIAPDKGETIAQALVTTAVSGFEVLIGSVAKEAFRVNKTALEKSDHEFTLEELLTYESIDEARSELINRRVEALLFKSVDEWSKWCEKILQFGLSSLTSNWPAVREIFARRNIIVHNGSKLNNRYIKTVQESGLSLPDSAGVGDHVVTDKAYVDVSIQQLLSLGLILTYSTWKKLYPRTVAKAANWLVDRQEALVYDEMWLAVQEITRHRKDRKVLRIAQCKSDVYGWLARKMVHGIESIREEVRDWDTSGLDVIFQIYQALLLGNIELASRLTKKNIGKSSSLTKYEFSTHPIFAELRAHMSISDL